ncbi:MAG: ATP-binding protein [Ignavibacteria bacterium]|nr:ATP-binding protein [Ignavibacteria bacterium]
MDLTFIIIIIFLDIVIIGGLLFLYFKKKKKINYLIQRINSISTLKDDDFEGKIRLLEEIEEELANSNLKNDDIYNNILTLKENIKKELQNAKRFKINRNEFLGNVAHELRTPIFAIQLSLETLLGGAINDNSVNIDFLNKAMNHTKRLIELSNDLVSISKLETGMRLSQRYVKVNELISEVVNSLCIVAQQKSLQMNFFSGVKDSLQVFCDAEAIKQVMVNLIDNAIKYTNEGGKIDIRIMKQSDEVYISVSDTGIGIPEECLPRIFERFYRVDKNRSREMGGSGLGLSIVKHILELHNSKITVMSEVGKGTTFRFSLPT